MPCKDAPTTSEGSLQPQSGTAPSQVIQRQYAASITCYNELSATGSNLGGVFKGFVELRIRDPHLLFTQQLTDSEEYPLNPTRNTTYGVNAEQAPTTADGVVTFTIEDGDVDFLPGLSKRFESNRDPKEWHVLPGEDGPWTMLGTLFVSCVWFSSRAAAKTSDLQQ